MLKKIQFSLFFAVLLLISSCSSTGMSESTGEYIDSVAVTAKIKAKIVDSLGTKALSIKVKTYKEYVQLSGFVNTTNVKNQAESIANKTSGVMKVRNDIIVKSRM